MALELEEDEKKKLQDIFFFFSFFMLGVFFRQIGLVLKLKSPHHMPLFLSGLLMGLYFVKKPETDIPILGNLNPIWFYSIYFPIYVFLGAFNLESDVIHARVIPHVTFVCIPIWTLSIASMTLVATRLFDFSFGWKEFAIMAVIIVVPDLQMTKLFMVSKFNFASQELYVLLEFESIVGNCIGSVVYLLFLIGRYDTRDEILFFFATGIFSCVVGYIAGKIAAAWVIRMHNDITNQITTVIVFIYVTFAVTTLCEASGDLAVFVFGTVMMKSKPKLTMRTVDMINRFIDTFRFAFVSSVVIIAGILFTIQMWNNFSLDYLILSIIIYAIIFASRIIIITVVSLVSRKYFFQSLLEALTISVCNMRGVFNIILLLTLRQSSLKFPMEDDRLFLLAFFQMFLSFFLTTPIASLMVTIQRRHTFDREKITMVHNAVRTINDYKESVINMLRRMAFTADADWSIVAARTSIKQSFLRKYEYNTLIKSKTDHKKITSSQLRQNAVKNVLRLQKRFLEEQFRHGTLGGQSAKFFASYMRKCLYKKSFMSAESIIKSMAPKQKWQIMHRDLVQATHLGKISKARSFFVASTLAFNSYLLLYLTFNRAFGFLGISAVMMNVSNAFSALMLLVSGMIIFFTGKSYINYFAHNLWNWLGWVICLSTFGDLIIDILFNRYHDRKMKEGKMFKEAAHYFFILLPLILMAFRSVALACFLESVQYLLYKFVTARLDKATFNQCDACQGFLQATVDTLQRVEDRVDIQSLSVACQNLLHQESLAMRQFLGVMDILTPKVIAALKTRIACRLVLMSQERIIGKLRHNGTLGEREVDLLTEAVHQKLKALYDFKPTIKQPLEIDMVKSIPWVAMTGISVSRVIDTGRFIKLQPGDVIISQFSPPSGVFVILDGLVRAELSGCKEKYDWHGAERRRGYLTRSSITTSDDDNQVLSDFFFRGNVIGEYPLLTGREAHKTYRCVTEVSLLALGNKSMYGLMGMQPRWGGPMNELEYNMWTAVANRLAARFIQRSATYHLLTRRQIYMMMEDAYIIDGLKEKHIDLNNLQKALVILLYGEMVSPSTGQIYKGPCIVPPNVSKLDVISSSGSVNALNYGHSRTVLFVLRSYTAMRLGKGLKPIREPHAQEESRSLNDLTVSSGSSDGIPCARQKVTVHDKKARSVTSAEVAKEMEEEG